LRGDAIALVAATNVDGVRDLLRCSMRTASDLAAAASDAAEAERDQQIAELKAEGKPVRAIAGTVISKSTVQRADVRVRMSRKCSLQKCDRLMTSRTHSDHARRNAPDSAG
jgi:hypothetical protein